MLLTKGELKRSRTRFALLTAGAGLLVFVLLFQQLLLGAVSDGLVGAVSNQSADIIVFAKDARRNLAGYYITPEQFDKVAQAQGVAEASELGVSMLALATGPKTVDAALIGYRPGKPGTPTNIVEGRLPRTDNEVLASKEDMTDRYAVGDPVVIEPGGALLHVVGLTAGSRYAVGPTLWIPWEGYGITQKSANMPPIQSYPNVVAVRPAPGFAISDVIKNINTAAPDLEAITRAEAVKTAPGVSAVQVAFSVVMGLGYLVVGVVIGFFFLTITLQKEPSIQLLRATGAPQSYLVINLVHEVLLVTVGGVIVGVGLLFLLVKFVRSAVPVVATPGGVAIAAFGALTVSLMGAIAPLRRILRTDPYAVVGPPALGRLG